MSQYGVPATVWQSILEYIYICFLMACSRSMMIVLSLLEFWAGLSSEVVC